MKVWLLLLALLCGAFALSAPVRAEVVVTVNGGSGAPGDSVKVDLLLRADGGETISAIDTTLHFDPKAIPAGVKGTGRPACQGGMVGTFAASAFGPLGCDPSRHQCTSVRIVILGIEAPQAIAEGVLAYSCTMQILRSTGPGRYALTLSGAEYATPAGEAYPATVVDGSIEVLPPGGDPTPTPQGARTPACTGDCDGSGSVSADDLTAFSRALFDADAVSGCTVDDPPQPLSVARLVAAVKNAAGTCHRLPTPSSTATLEPTAPPPTASPSPRPTNSPTPTMTPRRASTRTPTAPKPATSSPTGTRTATPSRTRSETRTPTRTRSATRTRTPTRTRTSTKSSTPTPSLTPRRTPTASASPSATPMVTPTATGAGELAASPTPTPSPDGFIGPEITFMGLAQADNALLQPLGADGSGVPVYGGLFGFGFRLLVEGRPGPSLQAVGTRSRAASDDELPDLLIEVDRPLGDGDPRPCRNGVPAIDPPGFSPADANAFNDLGCRFIDGSGLPRGRALSSGCVLLAQGGYGFASSASAIQFCAQIPSSLSFPRGDTLVTARLRDRDGNLGSAAQIIVRVPL